LDEDELIEVTEDIEADVAAETIIPSTELLSASNWTEATSLPEEGVYALQTDVTIGYACVLTGDLSIDLNGHSIEFNNNAGFKIKSYTFDLYDSAPDGISGVIKGISGTGVLVAEGTFNMYGGIISGWSRGVLVRLEGTFNMYGGTISKNSRGVYMESVDGDGCTFNVSRKVIISGNTNYNVYLDKKSKINITGVLDKSSSIGIRKENKNADFTSGWSTYQSTNKDVFFSDDKQYDVTEIDGELQLVDHEDKFDENGICSCGRHKHKVGNKIVVFEPVSTLTSGMESGNYVLTNDVVLNDTWNVNSNINLDLDGHNITTTNFNNDVISIQDTPDVHPQFSLYDCKNTGAIKGGENGVFVEPGPTFNMYGGTISGNNRGVLSKGTFEMSGGTISDNKIGVYLENSTASFEMSGGSISGNKNDSVSGGSGVYVKGGTFNMSGGSISKNENEIGEGGSGVYAESGTFNMSGGTISGNTAVYGGGVYVLGGTFNMSGGYISDNEAMYVGGVYTKQGSTISISGGSITGNKTTDTQYPDIYVGGLYLAAGTNLNLSGNVNITGNKAGDLERNVWVGSASSERSTINIEDSLDKSSSIGISMGAGDGSGIVVDTEFTTNWSKDYDKNIFYSDNSDYVVEKNINGTDLVLKAAAFTYEPGTDGKSLIEHCGNCNEDKSLSISAPVGTDKNGKITATGKPLEVEVTNGLLNSNLKGIGQTDVKYQKKNSNGSYEDISDAPTEAGTYLATLTVDTGIQDTEGNSNYTLTVEYTVEAHTHDYSKTYSSDKSQHWYDCTATTGTCDEPKTGVENHTWKDGVCSVCGYKCVHNGATSGTCTICGKSLDTNLIEGSDDGAVKIAIEKEKSNYAAAGLASTLEDVKQVVLTEDDKSAISEGKDINIWLELKDGNSTVSATDKALTENAIPDNYNLVGYLDITLWKQITGNNAVKVTNVPNGTVKVALTVPDAYQSTGRTYKIVRVHDGAATLLSTTLDSTTYKLTFDTDKFSSYALIYTDTATDNQLTDSSNPLTVKKSTTDVNSTTAASTDVKSSVTTATTPETGDNLDFALILILMCVSLAGILYTAKFKD
jgi:hypothetical protein